MVSEFFILRVYHHFEEHCKIAQTIHPHHWIDFVLLILPINLDREYIENTWQICFLWFVLFPWSNFIQLAYFNCP